MKTFGKDFGVKGFLSSLRHSEGKPSSKPAEKVKEKNKQGNQGKSPKNHNTWEFKRLEVESPKKQKEADGVQSTLSNSPPLSPQLVLDETRSESPTFIIGTQSSSRIRIFPEPRTFSFQLISCREPSKERANHLWSVARTVYDEKVRQKK